MGTAGGPGVSSIARIRVAENLRAVLEQRSLSLRAFERVSGCSRRHVQAVLSQTSNLRIDFLDRLATELQILVWRLLAPPPPDDYMQSDPIRFSARVLLSARIMRESSVHGLTLGDVAHACDCSPSWMYKIVERKVSASVDLLPALARVLRIELHELLLPAAHA